MLTRSTNIVPVLAEKKVKADKIERNLFFFLTNVFHEGTILPLAF